uniref:CYtochrome P450 family n=1 Tax=Caenorhabditis japonica TaxID=281687 RepID=A0A8R1E5Y6_CAEJA
MTRPSPGYECFRRWTQSYGDVYTFWLGSTPYVMLCSYDIIKETFIRDGDTYVDKIQQPFQEKFRGGSYGVVETNGAMWRDHRRFALHQLRDFGLGKDLMQEKILIEVGEMFKQFDATQGAEQDVPKVFDVAVANVINQVIFGYRFDGEKEAEFKRLKEIMDFQEKNFNNFKTILAVFIPGLGRILPGPTIDELLDSYKTTFYTFFDARIEEHRAKIDFDSIESQDYAEAYLKEQKKRESTGDSTSFCDKQLSNMCLDLWLAGLMTTTTTLSWAISYVLNDLKVLEKVHEEMDRVIGSDRLITTGDKSQLPYMSAVVNECQRCANILPINLMHATTQDTIIKGYHLPKGTGVIAQISTLMLDEKIFPEPYKFNPDRFIDEGGKLRKVEQLVPFSIGKRQCLGEGLARMELFLFLSNFFNRYQMSPSSEGPPNIDKSKDFGILPRRFSAVLRKRS